MEEAEKKKQEIHSLQDHHNSNNQLENNLYKTYNSKYYTIQPFQDHFFYKLHKVNNNGTNSNTRWTAPSFSFNTEDQPAAWKDFYTRVSDYLETIDIDPEQEDQHKRGWKQIKMMFTGEDRQALQILIDNNTITPADQCTPTLALKAIQTAIKDEEHYWHYRDKVLSDIRQQPEEQVHALSNRIITLANNCSFQDQQTTETIKIMLLQHAIRYHEARDWIRQ